MSAAVFIHAHPRVAVAVQGTMAEQNRTMRSNGIRHHIFLGWFSREDVRRPIGRPKEAELDQAIGNIFWNPVASGDFASLATHNDGNDGPRVPLSS